MTVNFYSKRPDDKGEVLISLYCRFSKQQVVYSTGIKVKESLWDKEKQRVRKSANSSEYNRLLGKLSEDVEKIYYDARATGKEVSVRYLKSELIKLEEAIERSDAPVTLWTFVADLIKSSETLKERSTLQTYRETLGHLQRFKKGRYKDLDFDSIDLEFYYDFVEFLTKEQGMSINTIGKQIKTLKTFLNEATERGINKKLDFKSKRFKVLSEEVDTTYLNEEEIQILLSLDLSDSLRLERVRDLFIVGCRTGLRFSDFSGLAKEDITNNRIRVRTQKTDEVVTIPIHPNVRQIMQKYSEQYEVPFPPAVSNQKMNEYLKEICKKAGLNELVPQTTTVAGKRTKTTTPKYELITTHTARRSFATNEYLRGTPTITIRAITGHRSEKAFLKYIKVSNDQHADILMKMWEDQTSLKVVV